jgi:predicted CopG family antitoxin
MAMKTITISKEAYDALILKRKNSESVSDIIIRLIGKRGRLIDSFGAWKMTDAEEANFKAALAKSKHSI